MLQRNPQAKLIIPAANREFVLERLGRGLESQLVGLDDASSTLVATIEFTGIAAAHNLVERDDQGRCRYLGYVARWNERTIYHSGDTLRHDAMAPVLKAMHIDVALLPINGNRPERRVAGNLDGKEAAQLAADIGARLVIPCHFDMFEFNTASPEEFVSECERLNQPCKVLANGGAADL